MTLMTRAVATIVALGAAAIPVAALTVKNSSNAEVSIAVDNGSTEAVYKVPAGGSVDVKEDCSADCSVTGPWGYSRLVAQNATIETDGSSLVTAGAAAPSAPAQALVPQNPGDDAAVTPAPAATEKSAPEAPAPATLPAAASTEPPKATAAAPAEPAAEAAAAPKSEQAAPAEKPRRRAAKPRRAKKQVQKGPGAGSLQMLFQGPGK